MSLFHLPNLLSRNSDAADFCREVRRLCQDLMKLSLEVGINVCVLTDYDIVGVKYPLCIQMPKQAIL